MRGYRTIYNPSTRTSTKKIDPFIVYLKLILQSILLTEFQTREIVRLLDKVSSRGLSFYQNLIHHSDYG